MAEGPSAPRDGVDLTAQQRADIDGMYLRLADSNHYELLGVSPHADRRAIRDAYFNLSQRFHPDAFYGRALGPWKARMEEIFREVTRAYDTLAHRIQRAEYDESIGVQPAAPPPPPLVSAPVEREPEPPLAETRPQPRVAMPPPPVAERAPTQYVPSPVVAPRAPPVVASPAVAARPLSERPAAPPPRPPVMDVTRPRSVPPPSPASPDETGARRAVAAAAASPAIAADAARRAAREALARRMGVAPPPRAGAAPPNASPGGAVKPSPSHPPPPSAPLKPPASADAPRTANDPTSAARPQNDRATRLARVLRDADESLARNDLLGASNALVVARAIAPQDTELAARAEQVALKLAESALAKNLEVAREADRAGHYDRAAEAYLKASAGRPNDASLLVRAATAMMKHGKELPRAAETARRALAASPRSMEAHVVLAQIFLAGGLRASAQATLESAQKLDPTSLVVKDLMKQCRGKS